MNTWRKNRCWVQEKAPIGQTLRVDPDPGPRVGADDSSDVAVPRPSRPACSGLDGYEPRSFIKLK